MPVAGQWIPDCQQHLSPKYWQHCVPKLTEPHWHEPSWVKKEGIYYKLFLFDFHLRCSKSFLFPTPMTGIEKSFIRGRNCFASIRLSLLVIEYTWFVGMSIHHLINFLVVSPIWWDQPNNSIFGDPSWLQLCSTFHLDYWTSFQMVHLYPLCPVWPVEFHFLWKNLTIMLIYFYSINCNWFLICVLQNWAVVTDKSSRKHPQIRKFLFVSSFTGTICRTNLTAIADFPQPPGPIRAIFSFLKQNSSFWSFMIIN